MTRSRLFLTLGCVAALAVMVPTAQAQNRQPGGGGRGGFPFGGGFGGGGGDPSAMLLAMEEVQKELELLDDQIADLKKARDAQQEKMMGLFTRPDPNQQLSDEERTKRREEMMKKMQDATKEMAKEMRAKITEVLLPHQVERLDQLGIQFRKTGALADEEVQKKLSFTAEQKAKVETVQNEQRDAMRAMFEAARGAGGGGGGGNDFRDKMTEMNKQRDTKLLAVLDDAQKKKFEEIQGKPFTFPEMRFGGGPGGGPGGRGNRPQRNNNQ